MTTHKKIKVVYFTKQIQPVLVIIKIKFAENVQNQLTYFVKVAWIKQPKMIN